MSQLTSLQEFKSFVADASLSLVHFYASWAPMCGQLNTVLGDLAEESGGKLRWAFIDAEGVPEVSVAHNISAAPTLLFFKNGKEIDRVNGFKLGDIKTKIALNSLGEAGAAVSIPTTSAPVESKDLNTRLKELITSHKVMLFMKGDPVQPRCGFSRTMIGLLKEHDIAFGSFDILSDEEVRQGLKTYSNWPTYPQLYIDGELIGGLDVFREELQDPAFVASLPRGASNGTAMDLDTRLKQLVNSAPLMLFMKGNAQQPRCGFSRQTIDLLNSVKADYKTFDILEDEEVRQGLKEYSQWPTYPQLYLRGELIGGLDVIREEFADAAFVEQLPKKE